MVYKADEESWEQYFLCLDTWIYELNQKHLLLIQCFYSYELKSFLDLTRTYIYNVYLSIVSNWGKLEESFMPVYDDASIIYTDYNFSTYFHITV